MKYTKDYTLSILTPTYNRAYTLDNLYRSLIGQLDKDLTWVVVDDGSTDNTEELISEYIRQNLIKIEYIKQENSGKHIAINSGVNIIATDLTMIVDSDDVLTVDAVKSIKEYWKKADKNNCVGVTFLRGYSETEVIGKKFPKNEMIDNANKVRYNLGISGDKAEVVRTNMLKKYPFPKFNGEKFLSEGILWKQLGSGTKTLFINEIIYITEYLSDGLTNSGRKLLIKNPLGAGLNAKLAMTKEFSFKMRLQNTLLYTAYGFFAKKKLSEIVHESGQSGLVITNLLFGWLIYRYWKNKYKL